VGAAVVTLRVETFAGAAAEWDSFVRSQPHWTHCHLFGWKAVIEQTFGHECIYLAARDDGGRLAGVLPLVRVKSWLFGHYLVSMPFLNYGGPLGGDAAVTALAHEATRLALRTRVSLLELRSRVPLPIALPASHRKLTVLLDLAPGDSDATWRRVSSRMRTYVRRTREAGVTVRFGPDQVSAFYAVFARHMRELGTPTHPRRLFDAIADVFGDQAWFGCAYYEGRPVACGCGLEWDDEVEVTWASSTPEFRDIRPNALLYWAFIERAARENLAVFNFGRCTPGGGTHNFKRQWGGRDEPLWWYAHAPNAADPASAKTPSPDDGAFSWGPRLWRRLPEPVATALGPMVVRCIP
jgi:FemAB-related protein (PEP-CTERM system-associated)